MKLLSRMLAIATFLAATAGLGILAPGRVNQRERRVRASQATVRAGTAALPKRAAERRSRQAAAMTSK
jgi:hypothetical protein